MFRIIANKRMHAGNLFIYRGYASYCRFFCQY